MRSERFHTPMPLGLRLKVPAGEIDLETLDGEETTVELEPIGRDEASREAVESARIELRERAAGGREVIVEVDERRGRGFLRGGSAEVRLVLRVPHGTDVRAEGASTDIAGQGSYGEVKISSASGDVEFAESQEASVDSASGDVALGRVVGEVRVNSASGDVAVVDAGASAEVNSASGDVRLERARAAVSVNTASGDVIVGRADSSVSVRTASGDVRIDSVARGEVSVQSASGDVRIGVARGSRVWMDVRSRSGETTSELEVGDAPPEETGELVEIRANSMSGDVEIVRAPAPAELEA